MNRDKACPDPRTWPDECGHGASTYIGTVPVIYNIPGRASVADVYVYPQPPSQVLVCLRSGPARYQCHHMALDLFWTAADAYPPWHPARDLLLSQGFAP